ncbi:hypothetical protein LINPERPRIM_LOCUS34278 [Linum perenne]
MEMVKKWWDAREGNEGMVLRGDRGELVAYRAVRSIGRPSPKECEARALLHALQWSHGHGVSHAIVEIDALEVHRALGSEEEDLSEFGDTIRSCKALLHATIKICHIPKTRNEVAHVLARRSRNFVTPLEGIVLIKQVYLLLFPSSLQRSLKKTKQKKTAANSPPVNIPKSNVFQFEEFEYEDDDSEELDPPHVFLGRRLAGKMAFSVCTGIGRTLIGRDLSQVRNFVLRMTGFLET